MEEILRPALQKAIEFLEANGLRYVFIGGMALTQWGVARFTQDVDIKVLVPDFQYREARELIRSRFTEAARADADESPLIVAVKIDGITVDFLLALPGYEELIITRSVRRKMDGWEAWVCSAEDLVIQKVVASREKDWLDVEELLIAQWGRLDLGFIESWLAQFAEALQDPDIPKAYFARLDKVKRLF